MNLNNGQGSSLVQLNWKGASQFKAREILSLHIFLDKIALALKLTGSSPVQLN
jgi:hypothetical protein